MNFEVYAYAQLIEEIVKDVKGQENQDISYFDEPWLYDNSNKELLYEKYGSGNVHDPFYFNSGDIPPSYQTPRIFASPKNYQ